jgi:hypothetical protein
LVAFRVGHRDAHVLKDEFSGFVVEDLTELAIGRCLVRIDHDWNIVRALPPLRPFLDHDRPRVIVRPLPVNEPLAEENRMPPEPEPNASDDLVR